MPSNRFDALTLHLANRGRSPISRRALAGWLAGGAAIAAGIGDAPSADGVAAAPVPARKQPARLNDVAGRAFDLEYDIAAIFRFVADEVRYEPYAGVLRGATGTLDGLAGNSADKALLLAALLAESMVETRFVVGTLDDAAATRLLASTMLTAGDARAHLAVAGLSSLPTPDAGPDTAPTAEQQRALDVARAAWDAAIASSTTRIADTVSLLTEALAGAGISLPDAAFALPVHETDQHVWLQYASGADWIDLDPTFAGEEPGLSPATPVQTLASLPDDWLHRVRFTVSAEDISKETPMAMTLLDVTYSSSDLVGAPVQFLHVEPAAFAGTGLAVMETIEGQSVYYPSLIVGADISADQPVVFAAGGTGALSAFGAAGNGPEMTGEWLTIEITSPGRAAVTVQREIFDRVGAARRAAGDWTRDDVADIELLPLAGIGDIYPPMVTVRSLAVLSGLAPTGAYVDNPPASDDILGSMTAMTQVYDTWRCGLASTVGIDAGGFLFHDRPNIVASILELADHAPDAPLVASVDLMHRSVGVTPILDVTGDMDHRLLAGALTHEAERVFLEQFAALDPAAMRWGPSVGWLFETAAADGTGTRVLTSLADYDMAGLMDIDPNVLARLRQRLEEGWIAVIPNGAIDLDGTPVFGWWLVDPVTGETRDQLGNGRETTMVETAQRIAEWVYGPLPKFRQLGCAAAFGTIVFSIWNFVGQLYSLRDAEKNGSRDAKIGALNQYLPNLGMGAMSLIGPKAACS